MFDSQWLQKVWYSQWTCFTPCSRLQCFIETVSKSLQSAVYTALIVYNMHHLGICLYFLCCSALSSHVSGGFSLYARTYGPAHILRHVQCTAWLRPYPFGMALPFIVFLLTCRQTCCWDHFRATEWWVQCSGSVVCLSGPGPGFMAVEGGCGSAGVADGAGAPRQRGPAGWFH